MPELTYEYRLYPTEKQAAEMRRICGCTRFLYNKLLEDKTREYRETKIWKKLDATPYLKLPFMQTVDPGALNWTIHSLETAFRNFFRATNEKENEYRPEASEKAAEDPAYVLMETDLKSYPRAKKKRNTKESYTTYLENLEVKDKRIFLPSLGRVKIRLHRPIPEEAEQICSTVLKKPSGDYYLLIRLKFPEVKKNEQLEKPLGIAFAPGKLAVRSDEVPITYRHQDSDLTDQINRAQKTLRRRKLGSRRYEKARIHLAKLYEHRANQRRDDMHKASRQIADAADTVYMQKADVTNRYAQASSKDQRFQQQDESWWTFSNLVEYKVMNKGNWYWSVVSNFPAETLCSQCGHQVKQIAEKSWVCPKCRIEMDRKLNASRNYMNLGAQYIQKVKEINT